MGSRCSKEEVEWGVVWWRIWWIGLDAVEGCGLPWGPQVSSAQILISMRGFGGV